MIIGLTGPIGSGKSTVAKLLASKGAVVVDADQIGRSLLDNNRRIQKQLKQAFGESICSTRGAIDRSTLASMAFRDNTARAKLNRIVHPALVREVHRQTKAAMAKQKVVVIDAALLLEWKMQHEVDLVLVVGAPKQTRLERLIARGVKRADALSRMKLQPSAKVFHAAADVLLGNTGTTSDLRKAVAFLWEQLRLTKKIR